MMKYEIQYKRLLERVRSGTIKPNRTGVHTAFSFSETLRHDCGTGFAFLTGKEMYFKNTVAETMWMLNGETNIKRFHAMDVHIWDKWADEFGDLGPVYGFQIRKFNNHYDQWTELLRGLKNDPYSRRHVVTMWNPLQLRDMRLPPCHMMFQFLYDGHRLHLQVFQRSADLFVGVPYDMALYNLILLLVAREMDMMAGELALTMTDCHIYMSHFGAYEEYLGRDIHHAPYIHIQGSIPILDHSMATLTLMDYKREPFIKVPIEG